MPKSFCCDHKPGQMIKKMRVQSNIHTKNISPWILRRLVYNNFSYLQHLTCARGFQWGGGVYLKHSYSQMVKSIPG